MLQNNLVIFNSAGEIYVLNNLKCLYVGVTVSELFLIIIPMNVIVGFITEVPRDSHPLKIIEALIKSQVFSF